MKAIFVFLIAVIFFSCSKTGPKNLLQKIDSTRRIIPREKPSTPQLDTVSKVPKRIIWFGDSITRGEASSDYNSKSYASLVSSYYGAENINYGYSSTCVNPADGYQGVPSHNLVDLYSLSNIDQKSGTFVCVQYGTNDLAGGFGSADRIPTWIGYYKQILDSVIAFGYDPKQIIIMTPPYEGTVRPLIANCVQPLHDLSSELGCRFFDTWDYCQNVGWVVGTDTEPSGIHPYDVGHQKIANGLIDYINNF
jgi:hypothetical protein